MFSWIQQQFSSPTVEMGQPITEETTVVTSKKKKIDEGGEMTEEGFVCVGRSSFYSTSEQPALPFQYNHNVNNLPYPYPSSSSSMYPPLPFAFNTGGNFAKQSKSSDPVHELLTQVPFVLSQELRVLSSNKGFGRVNEVPRIDWSQFEYNFENGGTYCVKLINTTICNKNRDMTSALLKKMSKLYLHLKNARLYILYLRKLTYF